MARTELSVWFRCCLLEAFFVFFACFGCGSSLAVLAHVIGGCVLAAQSAKISRGFSFAMVLYLYGASASMSRQRLGPCRVELRIIELGLRSS